MEISGILDGFGRRKTKPNKANLFRIEYCVMRIAERNLKKQACPERSRMEPKPAFGRKS